MSDTPELVRRYLLLILDAKRTSERDRDDDPSTYVAEAVLQLQLRKMGVPMLLSALRGELYYLFDKNLVKFHRAKVGREHYFSWRITAEGVDVVQGTRDVPGVLGA